MDFLAALEQATQETMILGTFCWLIDRLVVYGERLFAFGRE